MYKTYKLLFAIALLLITLPALAGKLQMTVEFRDHRAHRMNDIGSRLRSNTLGADQPLSYAKYSGLITRINPLGGFMGSESVSGYLDRRGSASFGLAAGDYILTMMVELESEIDGRKFHKVVKESDESDAYRQIFAKPFSVSSYGDSRITLNVSCPNSDCNNITMLDPENPLHMAANVYASGIDVYSAWGHMPIYDARGNERNEEFTIQFGCFETNDTSKPDFCSNCLSSGWQLRSNGCGMSSGFSKIRARGTAWNLNHLIAHEFGHNYYRRALGSDRTLGLNYNHVWSGPTLNASVTPVVDSDHYTEKGNTEEGWCNFFAVATYFDATARHPYYRFCGDYTECPHLQPNTKYDRRGAFDSSGNKEYWAKFNLEGETWTRTYHMNNDPAPRADRNCGVGGATGVDCIGACVGLVGTSRIDAPHLDASGDPVDLKMVWEAEGNVARFFWDLFDVSSNNDAPSLSYTIPEHCHGFAGNANTYADRGDNSNLSRSEFLTIWKAFPDHDKNRGRMEPFSTPQDKHGRNIVDYRKNAHDRVSVNYNFWGEYLTNCLLGQDPD
jgi:hypothetical protein